MNRAVIAGISGQDGILLSQLLRKRGVDYLGIDRRGVVQGDGKLIEAGDILDAGFVEGVVKKFRPAEIYYLVAHHHSSQDPALRNETVLWQKSLETQVMGLVHFLEALRRYMPKGRLFYAASSHVFGTPGESPQNEETSLKPNSVYGITKVAGLEACRRYREDHGLFTAVGFLYNHESVYRKAHFLSQKIIRGARAIQKGDAPELVLGDLSSRVDWGYAPDYVDAMTRMLRLPEPDDFIVATGENHSVRDFVRIAFQAQGLDYRDWVRENPAILQRQSAPLVGDAAKLRRATGWAPSVSFAAMVQRLTQETIELIG